MTGSDRRQALKLHWYARGRADALVAIAADLGWHESFTYAQGRRIHVAPGDTHEALERATECARPLPMENTP